MQLYCSKCHRVRGHGDITDHGDGLMGTGPPSRRITARCLTCSYNNDHVGGYVVTEANLAAEMRAKL